MVVPLVVFLIGFIFYLTFYLYDRCVVSQDAYLLAFRGSICCEKNPEEIRQYVLADSSRQFGTKYIGLSGLISTVETDNKKVTVKVSGTMGISFAEQLLPQKCWYFQTEKEAQRICPAEFIRKVRLVKKIENKANENNRIE